MAYYSRAYIYDASELAFRNMAKYNSDPNTFMIPVQSPPKAAQAAALNFARDQLVSLLNQGTRLKSLVFVSHGKAGAIRIDRDTVDATSLRNIFGNHSLQWLMAETGRVYFAGCNVADKEAGWQFLEAAAHVFLTGSGGAAFGWDSYGFGLTRSFGLVPNIAHLWGRTRYVLVSTDGKTSTRKDSVGIEHEIGMEMRKEELEREND
jgi:hypothetical protein